eukprot:CAMPEP_0176124054 /NCGR_PEP_ID=MMETSP0120_2-20121206/62533_1 /TAXON_ID=160619 /ORGANISM="Kryptoperidinium foliaceum, Strain CCMP 1326" /LENGTH=76 /DNA_ID=CAMNT_0017458799 /DNA_START=202 /DNA_END=432 /DNA_ORIENTATION=+
MGACGSKEAAVEPPAPAPAGKKPASEKAKKNGSGSSKKKKSSTVEDSSSGKTFNELYKLGKPALSINLFYQTSKYH